MGKEKKATEELFGADAYPLLRKLTKSLGDDKGWAYRFDIRSESVVEHGEYDGDEEYSWFEKRYFIAGRSEFARYADVEVQVKVEMYLDERKGTWDVEYYWIDPFSGEDHEVYILSAMAEEFWFWALMSVLYSN